MPITVKTPIRRLTQGEFGEIAYEVMGVVYRLQSELGRRGGVAGVGAATPPELISVDPILLGRSRSVDPSHTPPFGRKSPTRNDGFGHSHWVLARWKSLVDGAGVLRRAGKDFFGTPRDYGDSEKTFLARWRATAASKRLFRRAGGLQRAKKDFFRTLEDSDGLEKSFPTRWRTNRGRKRGRFWHFCAGSRFAAGDSVNRSTFGWSGRFNQHRSATKSDLIELRQSNYGERGGLA